MSSSHGEYNSSQALTPAPFAAAGCLTHRGEYVSQARGDALRLALPISVQLVLAVAAAAQRADAVAAPLPRARVCVPRWVQAIAVSQSVSQSFSQSVTRCLAVPRPCRHPQTDTSGSDLPVCQHQAPHASWQQVDLQHRTPAPPHSCITTSCPYTSAPPIPAPHFTHRSSRGTSCRSAPAAAAAPP